MINDRLSTFLTPSQDKITIVQRSLLELSVRIRITLDLLPKIQPDTVIVMDNATFHKRADMIQAIESHGCIVEFLPTYSPDLNPIEHKWAQAKALRKKYRCDNIDQLFYEHTGYIIL